MQQRETHTEENGGEDKPNERPTTHNPVCRTRQAGARLDIGRFLIGADRKPLVPSRPIEHAGRSYLRPIIGGPANHNLIEGQTANGNQFRKESQKDN